MSLVKLQCFREGGEGRAIDDRKSTRRSRFKRVERLFGPEKEPAIGPADKLSSVAQDDIRAALEAFADSRRRRVEVFV